MRKRTPLLTEGEPAMKKQLFNRYWVLVSLLLTNMKMCEEIGREFGRVKRLWERRMLPYNDLLLFISIAVIKIPWQKLT